MTNQQILTKAIQKALDGGWKCPYLNNDWSVEEEAGGHYKIECLYGDQLFRDDYQRVIFNHEFAKSLWGDWPPIMKAVVPSKVKSVTDVPMWQYHLQQMVIAEDPIKYLGEHLDV